MAWTEQLPSGRWRGMYRDSTKRKKSAGTFTREGDALVAATNAENEARLRSPESVMLWKDWRPIWEAGRKVEASTLARDNSRIEQHVLPRWGDVPLCDIRRPDVQRWIDTELKHLSASTVRKIVAVLGGSLRAAVVAGILNDNQATTLNLPQLEPSPERWLSVAEVEALRAIVPDDERFMFELLVGTGLRWGEAVGLHWDFVDLDRSTLTVRWAWDRTNYLFKSPKSRQKRTLPIGEMLAGMFRDRLADRGRGTPTEYPYQGGNRPMYGPVMATDANKIPEPRRFAAVLEAAGKVAKVDGKAIGPIRPHDLRHSYASQLVQRGVALDTVRDLLGHSSVTVTERYSSAADSQWDAVRNVLG